MSTWLSLLSAKRQASRHICHWFSRLGELAGKTYPRCLCSPDGRRPNRKAPSFICFAFMSDWQIHLFCCSCCQRCCHLLTSEPSFCSLPTGTDDQWLSRDLLDLRGHVGAAGVTQPRALSSQGFSFFPQQDSNCETTQTALDNPTWLFPFNKYSFYQLCCSREHWLIQVWEEAEHGEGLRNCIGTVCVFQRQGQERHWRSLGKMGSFLRQSQQLL